MDQSIQNIPNGYNYQNPALLKAYNNAPVLNMQAQPTSDSVQFGQNPNQPQQEKSFLAKHWGGILLAVAGIVGGLLLIKHGCKDIKDGVNTVKKVAVEGTTKKVVEDSLEELLKKRETAQGEDLIDLTQKIIKNTTDDNKLLEENHKLLELLDKAEKGEIVVKKGSFRTGQASIIPVEKQEAFFDIGKIHEKRNDNVKALEFYHKALQCDGNSSGIIPTMMPLYIKEGKADEGIALAMKHLEPMKNELSNDNQMDLIKSLAVGLKAKKQNDMAEAFELLVKGNYHYDQLTKEDFAKLSKIGLNEQKVKQLTGGNGREQTGVFTRWVIDKMKSLQKK